ncbi:MAG: extracellular solute-binding protein [Phycisphaerales bacterium]
MHRFLTVLLAVLTVCACSRTRLPQDEVVVYSSVDAELLEHIANAFEQQTGVRVLLVTDNEAVKTTGLVQRLRAERSRPRADVWWSSEPLGTIELSHLGVLAPYASVAAESSIPGGWPAHLRGPDWYGFGLRFRVLAYAPERVATPPRTLGALVEPEWRGRVGMARPQFGTTRSHMAVLLHVWGPDRFRSWLQAMRDNGLRLYDGNAAAVRAVRQGEIDLCLTDTDDVWAAQRNGWNIQPVYEVPSREGRFASTGPIALPNTIALVRGGPNPQQAQQFIDFVLSERAARMMAESDSHNIPIDPKLRAELSRWAPPDWTPIDLVAIEARAREAVALCEDVLR